MWTHLGFIWGEKSLPSESAAAISTIFFPLVIESQIKVSHLHAVKPANKNTAKDRLGKP